MTEQRSEIPAKEETARVLPDGVKRQLITVKGRSGLLLQDLENWVVENQAQFGRGEDDYVAMVEAHQNTNMGIHSKILGVREEVRKRRQLLVDGVETEFVEATPEVKNVWVGPYVKLLTPEEAAKTDYAGQTALKWATINKVEPEMVVKANDAFFYPATRNDVVITTGKTS